MTRVGRVSARGRTPPHRHAMPIHAMLCRGTQSYLPHGVAACLHVALVLFCCTASTHSDSASSSEPMVEGPGASSVHSTSTEGENAAGEAPRMIKADADPHLRHVAPLQVKLNLKKVFLCRRDRHKPRDTVPLCPPLTAFRLDRIGHDG